MFSLIFQPFFPENLRGLFSNKKPTSTEHLLCHRLYIIKRVLLKMYIPKYAFVPYGQGPFYPKYVLIVHRCCYGYGITNKTSTIARIVGLPFTKGPGWFNRHDLS